MGTPSLLLRCIKACITTPKFSICVNGELTGFFADKRRVRQGDPLSLFLFLIAMEAFSRSLSMAVDSCRNRVIRNQQNLFPKFLLLP